MKKIDEKIIQHLTPALTAYKISGGSYAYPNHIKIIDKSLIDISTGKINRLIINMPPRHGKSELISKYFPFWYLCNYPDNRVILCSYESTYAQNWGRKVSSLIDEYGMEFFSVCLKSSPQTAAYFEIAGSNGSMTSVGAGGPITGKGADLIIIDDPVKNDEEANSPTYRDKIWDWYRSTVFTRVEPNGAIILIMTRWHEDDLVGRIINEMQRGGQHWETLIIPAIAEQDDPIGRNQGEPLWSKRFNLLTLKEIRKTIGEYWFNALYQQRPSPAGGGIFKKKYFRYFSQVDGNFVLQIGENQQIIKISDCRFYITVDLAISLSTSSDFTVIMVVAVTNDNKFLICDIFRKRVEPGQHHNLVNEYYHKYNPILVGIESVQYQTALVKSVSSSGIPVIELKPDSDKLTRALPMAAKVELGGVFFNSDAVWLSEFESELLSFPKSKHDDQVDAFSYIFRIVNYGSENIPTGVKVVKNY